MVRRCALGGKAGACIQGRGNSTHKAMNHERTWCIPEMRENPMTLYFRQPMGKYAADKLWESIHAHLDK